MSALPPPQPGTQPVKHRRFYEGYKAWHWTLLVIGAVLLVLALGPAWWALFSLGS